MALPNIHASRAIVPALSTDKTHSAAHDARLAALPAQPSVGPTALSLTTAHDARLAALPSQTSVDPTVLPPSTVGLSLQRVVAPEMMYSAVVPSSSGTPLHSALARPREKGKSAVGKPSVQFQTPSESLNAASGSAHQSDDDVDEHHNRAHDDVDMADLTQDNDERMAGSSDKQETDVSNTGRNIGNSLDESKLVNKF